MVLTISKVNYKFYVNLDYDKADGEIVLVKGKIKPVLSYFSHVNWNVWIDDFERAVSSDEIETIIDDNLGKWINLCNGESIKIEVR